MFGDERSRRSPPSRRIKELEVMVADVVVETPDTSTLVFFTGNDHLEYKAGHFLTIDPAGVPMMASTVACSSVLSDARSRSFILPAASSRI